MILVHIRFFRFLYQVQFKYLIPSLFPFAYMSSKLQIQQKNNPPNTFFTGAASFVSLAESTRFQFVGSATHEASTSALLWLAKESMLSTEKQNPSCHSTTFINKLKQIEDYETEKASISLTKRKDTSQTYLCH